MRDSLNHILMQASELRVRFGLLSDQLKDASSGLRKRGEVPPGEMDVALSQARDDFSALCAELEKVAAQASFAPAVAFSAPRDLNQVERAARKLLRQLDEVKSKGVVAAASSVLEKAQLLRHVNGIEFPPLAALQTQARELQRLISASGRPTPPTEAVELASGSHSVALLMSWIEDSGTIDDERWAMLDDAVTAAFGKPMAVAVARRHLKVQPPAEPEARNEGRVQALDPPAATHEDLVVGADTEEMTEGVDPDATVVPDTIADDQLPSPVEQSDTEAPGLEEPESATIPEQDVEDVAGVIEETEPTPSGFFPFDQQLPAHEVASRLQELSTDRVGPGHHQLLWALLGDTRGELAFQLSRAAGALLEGVSPKVPTWLLRSLIVGPRIRHSGGALALDLQCSLSEYGPECFAIKRPDWNEPIRLLLASATLRASLLAPETGAPSILKQLNFKEGLGQLYELCQAIADFGSRYQPLNPASLMGVRDLAAWEKCQEQLQQEAEAWFGRAHQMTMAFAAATQVWKRWLEPGQLIHSLVTPVISGELQALSIVKREVIRLSEESVIRRELNQTDQRASKRRRPEITSKARASLVKHTREAIRFAERWVQLVELQPQQEAGPDQAQAEKLRDSVLRLRDSVLAELEMLQGREGGLCLRVGLQCCRQAVTDINLLFDPESPVPEGEPELRHLLNADLLRLRGISLGDDWEVQEIPDEVLRDELLRLAQEAAPDWEGTLDGLVEQGNHLQTERISRYLEDNFPSAPALIDLEARRDRSIKEWQGHLKRRVQEARIHLEKAVAFGFLREAQRTKIVERISAVEQAIPSILDFSSAMKLLESLRLEIDGRQQEEVDKIRVRLRQVEEGLEEGIVKRVSGVLDRGDVLTANEYIDMALAGREIPEESSVLGGFDRFFPETFRALTAFLDRLPTGSRPAESDLVLTLRRKNRATFGPLNLNSLPGPQVQQAADLLEAWFDAKKSKTLGTGQLRIILRSIGFDNPVVPETKATSGKVAWVKCDVSPVSDRERCPVAMFGSSARGRYRVLPVWGRPTEEDLGAMVGDLSHAPASLVLYFGRMTERVRRDLARFCRRRRRSFIVIDDAVILYLCQERQARLRVMFECTLPFTFVEPYSTTAGLVPPEMFYGRQRERAQILDPFGSCFIYGGRQLGKTALLRDLERTFHAPDEGRIALWLDLRTHGIGVERPVEDIWDLLASEFKRLHVIPPTTSTQQVNPEVVFKHFEAWLDKDANRRILLLLDESDRFLDLDGKTGTGEPGKRGDFVQTGRLKGFMDRTGRRFKVVFAGLHNVQRTTRVENNPLAHYGEPTCIGPLLDGLEIREARALIEKPLAGIGYRFENQDLVTRILSQTNYYPSLIQLYCSHLLRHVLTVPFDQDHTPPFVITAQHVEDAYKSQDLRKAIRDRFMWTLDLDPRYRLVAFCLALHSNDLAQGSSMGGYTVPWIRDQAMTFWPQGFKDTASEDAFRALLDEMVGLGVLRTEDGRFALRSLNVITMLGSQDEIEAELLSSTEQEPPLEYEPSTFRKAYRSGSGEVDLARRSPLTALQVGELCSRRNAVTVVVGSPGSGLDDVMPFLEVAIGPEHLRTDRTLLSADDLMRHVDALTSTTSDELTLFIVPADCPWDLSWVRATLKAVQKPRSKRSHLRIVFLAGPENTWELLDDGGVELGKATASGLEIVSLGQWADPALRQWLDDCGLAAINRDGRPQVSEETGNWPGILRRFYEGAKSDPHLWRRSLESLPQRLRDEAKDGNLLGEFGLDRGERLKVLRDLGVLGEAPRDELAGVVEKVPENVVMKVVRWGELQNLIQPVGNGRIRLDPTVERILAGTGPEANG